MDMSPEEARVEELIGKIRALPPQRQAEVEKFVRQIAVTPDREALHAMQQLAETAFATIWDDPADAAYDSA